MRHKEVELILESLQQGMINAGYWSDEVISADALSSKQPFCIDTMTFNQWLQFIFIPNMQMLVNMKQTLPKLVKGQGLEPMASEVYKNTEVDQSILIMIRQIDELLQYD